MISNFNFSLNYCYVNSENTFRIFLIKYKYESYNWLRRARKLGS